MPVFPVGVILGNPPWGRTAIGSLDVYEARLNACGERDHGSPSSLLIPDVDRPRKRAMGAQREQEKRNCFFRVRQRLAMVVPV